MQFIETRGNDGKQSKSVQFSDALLNPLASFGGLYSPESLPRLTDDFLETHLNSDYKKLAKAILTAFEVDIDPAIIDEALNLYDSFDDPVNPVPVVPVRDDLYVSELYHGPTRAFKDMALQPFGIILSALAQARDKKYLILAATSGDTGPAALETFKNKPNIQVACLYPDGGTSDVQRLQMVTEDAPNLKVIGIKGNFDDAQSALKHLLGSQDFKASLLQNHISVSAANSVNFGRIIFQIIYHIHSYLSLVRQSVISQGDRIYLNIPSGNFGNALGAYYACKMGLPVEKIIISSNRNNVLTDLIETGRYDLTQRNLIATSSPAMDILVSSNVERILFDMFGTERTFELMNELKKNRRYQLRPDEHEQLKQYFTADFCSDEEGLNYIRDTFDSGYLMDPHTATCFKSHDTRRDQELVSVVYSTAEWTKFSPVINLAISGNKNSADQEALASIAETAGIDIPAMIDDLFNKPIAQPTVINPNDIEQEILSFLNR